MKLFTADQIKRWDAATIEKEGISSLELMERAAGKCVNWLNEKGLTDHSFYIYCGKGNNGGDGLAIARLLAKRGYTIEVYILELGNTGTTNFQINLQRLREQAVTIHFIQASSPLPSIDPTAIIIDALFGAGLNRPLAGISKELVQYINLSGATVVSIDLPSGLFLSQSSVDNAVIEATYTLSFQSYKLALLLAENARYVGEVSILDIGLDKNFYEKEDSALATLDFSLIQQNYIPRNRFSHKGTFGHALLIGGSYGKIGALVLAATACARSGCGLLSTYLPKCGYTILQTALPEAMAMTDRHEAIITRLPENLSSFTTIGIGPGLGTEMETQEALIQLITTATKPIVIDADALNCLSLHKDLLLQLSPYSILTPHPKEFDRLFGDSKNEVERIEKAIAKAQVLKIIIVLKGHHTLIALPNGKGFFNTTGNAGMAKGGSGDVLTGIITALLAQGYSTNKAALLGVYLHGLAGDEAAKTKTQETMLASDIIYSLTEAFRLVGAS